MRVFHLTYWYPNKHNPTEGIWIRRHIQSLAPYVDSQFTYHFELKRASQFLFSIDQSHKDHSSFRLAAPVPWRVIEIFTFLGVCLLLGWKARRYDIVNVHIAYPLLTYFHVIKKILGKKIVITEHWSAYNFNFGSRKKLPRIQRIFANDLPVVTVSEKLRIDIETFSHRRIHRSCVIPNAVDSTIFARAATGIRNTKTFFMLSSWKWPKRPDVVLQAFAQLIQDDKHSGTRLKIAGCESHIAQVTSLVSKLNLMSRVEIMGNLQASAVADQMSSCTAFLHCSEYETFSVVCAEAICCGTPVVASAVGALPELINESNGVLISENTVSEWVSVLTNFNDAKFDRDQISAVARERFSFEAVGQKYSTFLSSL